MITEKIIVLDFGGQYAHLIANRIKRLNVLSEIKSPNADTEDIKDAKGIILSGGPASVFDPDQPRYNPEIFSLGKPILGICYGHQLLSQHLGGKVETKDKREYGPAELLITSCSTIFRGLEGKERVWMSHGDSVVALPPGFRTIACTADCPKAAIEDPKRKIYGIQFHPEVTQTPGGMKILDNFLTLCGCRRDWTPSNYIDSVIQDIKDKVGTRNVFLFVSGGVDSTVAFSLLNKALGSDRVLGLHIDNGFMRKGETQLVEKALKEQKMGNFKVIDASKEFLDALRGVVDPEEKREIIGDKFVEVREKAIRTLNLDPERWLLGQGTLYTDTIEAGGTADSAVIKTHHNRTDAIQRLILQGKVIEPLANLYKDEVREIGISLNLPQSLVWRHTFPGPGLAVRTICWDGKEENTKKIKEVDQKVKDIAKGFNLTACVLPLKTVGVQGDFRTYAHPVALATSKGCDPDWETLEKISTTITNSIKEVNRCVYLLKPDRLHRGRLKETYLSQDRLDLLRDADYIATRAIEKAGLVRQISQMPVVLIPLSSDGEKESVVVRPVDTDDFMTATFSKMPMDIAIRMAQDILSIEQIEAVYYDITHKPPGTIEWE